MTTPDPDTTGESHEPLVLVPAGLVGTATELLYWCDQLINHPGHDHIDTHLHQVMHRSRNDPATAARWLYQTLLPTARDLRQHLEDQHILVEDHTPTR